MNDSACNVLRDVRQMIDDYLEGKETTNSMHLPDPDNEQCDTPDYSDTVDSITRIAETTWQTVVKDTNSVLFVSPEAIDSVFSAEFDSYAIKLWDEIKQTIETDSFWSLDRWLKQQVEYLLHIHGSNEYSATIYRIGANMLTTFRLRMCQQLGKLSYWPDIHEILEQYIDELSDTINCRFDDAWKTLVTRQMYDIESSIVIPELKIEFKQISNLAAEHHREYHDLICEHRYEAAHSKICEWKLKVKREFVFNCFSESYYLMLCNMSHAVSELVNFVDSRGLE